MARKFLYLIAILIMLAIAATFAYRLFGVQMMRVAMVPTTKFVPQPGVQMSAYAQPEMWLARPEHGGDLGARDQLRPLHQRLQLRPAVDNPALWTPEGFKPGAKPEAAVFFIHPTSYLDRASWNAPLDNQEANDRAAVFLRGQASAFNEAGEVWAPRYRQATFGAFLTDKAEVQKALDLAYGDIASAFDRFLFEIGKDRPIILAGHSQGALHLTRLLREKVAGKPVARRIVAAYVVGWPVSRDTDVKALGFPECTGPNQSGCLLSWQSFAEPADPSLVLETYDSTTGFDGRPRKGTAMVCTNPLTGAPDTAALAAANLGTLVPSDDLKTATLTRGAVPARCGPNGFLLIGDPPEVGPYVLLGNNYHVYDYSLFWANVRADAVRRLAAYKGQ